MKELIEILEGLNPDIDYENTKDLVDGHYLDSLTILSLVSEIEEKFEVEIPTIEIVPNNFNSVEALWNLITKLQKDE